MKTFEGQILKAIEEKVFPGAALLVALKGEILYRGFFGSATLLPQAESVTEKTLWDIASLTKPVATASLILLSLQEKGLSLNTPVSRYLKELDEEKKEITIRHLLKHTSGLPAWRPYFEEIAREHPEAVGKRECRQYYLEKISQEPLEIPVGYRRIYSDLGFILLGILIERIWESRGGVTPPLLDHLFAEKIAGPLGMKDTFYVPVGASSPRPYEEFAATEDSAGRKKIIRGEVHDDNAYAMGGIAGHAGLFSTVDDLHRFLVAYETGYRVGAGSPRPYFPPDLVTEFIGPKVKVKLGWDTPALSESQAGRYFSKNSIGHLGFTGCSFWADLEQDFHVILLTNRVHPTSQNEAIKQFRPRIHDLIYEEVIRKLPKPLTKTL